jgi:ubiquinone/menaquinone biosynthesis C-methylase UbiE
MGAAKYNSDYDNSGIHAVYNKSRNLPEETLNMWMSVIYENINIENIKSVIDLGCGTGRFTEALSHRFNCNVTGIDPSIKMLTVARETIVNPLIKFVKGDSGNITAENDSVDMIYLSQVYHHIVAPDLFVKESKRVLRGSGYICIRNSTVNNMESYLYPKFFPGAYEIDMNRLPVRENILNLFESSKFRNTFCKAVKQIFALNHIEYFDKISMRGCSDLAAISDEDFNSGLEKLKEYCYKANPNNPVYEEIDLLIFEKI